MPFKILCSCGVALLAGDDLESFKVACPECGNYSLLPSVPDPYKLPSNAEMIPIEGSGVVAPRQKEKVATVRKRGGMARGNSGGRPQNNEMSTTNVLLIVGIVIVLFIIAMFGLATVVG